MIRFPKRPRNKSIDLEDDDLVEIDASDPNALNAGGASNDPDALVDTGVVPPKPRAAAALGRGRVHDGVNGRMHDSAPSSLAPMAMRVNFNRGARGATPSMEETFQIPRVRMKLSTRDRLAAFAGDRPSLPWAAVLLALGAIGAAGSMRLLDAVEGRSARSEPSAATPVAAAVASVVPDAPVKPEPVVLKFGADDAVTVAVAAPPKPALMTPPPTPPPMAAPKPIPAVAVAPVAASPSPPPPVQSPRRIAAPASLAVASPAPVSPAAFPAATPAVVAGNPSSAAASSPGSSAAAAASDAARRAATVDSLADAQLKAALK